MVASMTPLRDEHRGLIPEITALRDTADMIGAVPTRVLAEAIASRIAFLRHHLRPHAEAEDEVLYPVVARLLGNPAATATMRRDHVEVARLTDDLGRLHGRLATDPLDDRLTHDLRAALYGLYAVVSLHFAEEEEVYLPLLEGHLSPEEADTMFGEMHAAHERLAPRH